MLDGGSSEQQFITIGPTCSELEVFSIKTEPTPPLKIQESHQNRGPVGERDLGGSAAQPRPPASQSTGLSPGPLPTLHVKDRVQGFLVSRSMTPQWMSGSNSLSVKSTKTLPWVQHSFIYSENRNLRFSYFRQIITWSNSITLSINGRNKMFWALKKKVATSLRGWAL